MVYALVLGTSGAILGGSSPLLGTKAKKRAILIALFFNSAFVTQERTESRRTTVRGGVASFFSRKILVTKSSIYLNMKGVPTL